MPKSSNYLIFTVIFLLILLITQLNCQLPGVVDLNGDGQQQHWVKVQCSLIFTRDSVKSRAKGVVLFSPDDKVRMEIMGPFGKTLMAVVYDGIRSTVIFPEERKFIDKEGFILSGNFVDMSFDFDIFRSMFTGFIKNREGLTVNYDRQGRISAIVTERAVKVVFRYRKGRLEEVKLTGNSEIVTIKNYRFLPASFGTDETTDLFRLAIPKGFSRLNLDSGREISINE